MKKKPFVLTALSWTFAMIALAIPLQIIALYGHGPLEIMEILGKITALNWLVIVLCAINVAVVARASRLIVATGPLLVLTVAINNWVVGMVAIDYSPFTAALATVGFLGLQLPLFHPKIRPLFHQPAMRWWLQAQRKKIHVPVYIGSSKSKLMHSETFDLSESGAFIPCPISPSVSQGFDLESRIDVSIALGVHTRIRCDGRVVRHADARGNYPSGIGIQFLNLRPEQRQELRKYLDKQSAPTL